MTAEPTISDGEFARRIRMARAYLDLTLIQAGEHLGISPSQLSVREHADENGLKLRPADRLYMATVYCNLANWPMEIFTEPEMPPIPLPQPVEDELEPAEVVDLVERQDEDRDLDGGTAGA